MGDLKKLKKLTLSENNLITLPKSMELLYAIIKVLKNKIRYLPKELTKIKQNLNIDETSYAINCMDINNEILIFSSLNIPLSNISINTKEIWLYKKNDKETQIKLPLNCNLIYWTNQ
jgi:hypothetical protein